MVDIRHAAVAGTFYPADKEQLQLMLNHYLNEVSRGQKVPKAIIVPHAGYIYSGPVAATAYARLKQLDNPIKRVVLIGPSHRLGFNGLALSSAGEFESPLGNISVDVDAVKQLADLAFVDYIDQAHELEHSLEVHLPFLQTVLPHFSLVPVVAGDAAAEQVCQLLEMFWGQDDCLIVISSDLSHFHDYLTAQKLDKKTSDIFEKLQYEKLDGHLACGYVPVCGLLALARKYKLQLKTVDLRNSGDTGGSNHKSRVVGYGAYVIE